MSSFAHSSTKDILIFIILLSFLKKHEMFIFHHRVNNILVLLVQDWLQCYPMPALGCWDIRPRISKVTTRSRPHHSSASHIDSSGQVEMWSPFIDSTVVADPMPDRSDASVLQGSHGQSSAFVSRPQQLPCRWLTAGGCCSAVKPTALLCSLPRKISVAIDTSIAVMFGRDGAGIRVLLVYSCHLHFEFICIYNNFYPDIAWNPENEGRMADHLLYSR